MKRFVFFTSLELAAGLMAVATHEAWSVPGTAEQPPRDPSLPPVMTDYIQNGRVNVDDANARMVKEFSEKNSLPVE